MIGFLRTLWNEMLRGSFSFLILIVGILQLIAMIVRRRK